MKMKKKRIKVDDTALFRDIDARMKYWVDRRMPFVVPLKFYPENQKIILEAVQDYASDRKLTVMTREVAEPNRKESDPITFNAIFTEKT